MCYACACFVCMLHVVVVVVVALAEFPFLDLNIVLKLGLLG
jgi:hypothetical protein